MLTDKQTDRHTGENITFLAEVIKWSCSAGMCGIVWKKVTGSPPFPNRLISTCTAAASTLMLPEDCRYPAAVVQ